MKKLYYLIVLALILGLVLTGCELLSNISQVPATEQSGITYLTKATEGAPFVTDLIADGGDLSIDVGDVLVWNDGDYLYVEYVTTDDWVMTETHLAVTELLENIPQKNSNPIPGKFPYQYCYDEDEGEWVFKIKNGGAPSATCDADGNTVATLTEILYTIPLNGWEVCTELYIAAHAVVQNNSVAVDWDIYGEPISWWTETAWADGDSQFFAKNWATYFTYHIAGVPPTISSLDLAGPFTVNKFEYFDVRTVNPDPPCGQEYPHVLFNYTIWDTDLSDIASFEYPYFDGTDWIWVGMPMEDDTFGNVTGYFGDKLLGFLMLAPYDVETEFRINFTTPGTYPVTITLNDLDDGNAILAILTEDVVVYPETAPLAVGDLYGGGKVAYFFQDNGTDPDDPGYIEGEQHGLIAAIADATSIMPWSNITGTLIGTTGIEIGDGQENTTLIVDQIVGTTQCTSGAAYYCDNLTIGVYDDWFLPSRDELNKLFINKDAIGGFAVNYYWSSSELNAYDAWFKYFPVGGQNDGKKYYLERVRAVRAF